MKMLYAPWREEYAEDVTDEKNRTGTQSDCVFCVQRESGLDSKYGILRHFDHTFVTLNKYPYNAGHILILPVAHVDNLFKLSKVVRAELMDVVSVSVEILKKALKSEGVNVGINLGNASGAGIPSHLHVHILPRWHGDTNFMPTIGQTKVISFDLNTIYKTLSTVFREVVL